MKHVIDGKMFIVTPDTILQATIPAPTFKAMRRHVLGAMSSLAMFKEDLEDAMAMEVADLLSEYREERQYAKECGKTGVSDGWLRGAGEQIEDLCQEYGYPSLLPDGWENADPEESDHA